MPEVTVAVDIITGRTLLARAVAALERYERGVGDYALDLEAAKEWRKVADLWMLGEDDSSSDEGDEDEA